MGNVLNRTTKEFKRSVNSPDYPPDEWLHNPDLSAVEGVSKGWWVIDNDVVREATTAEKNANLDWYKAGVKLQGFSALDAYLGTESEKIDILAARGNQACLDHVAPYLAWRETVFEYMAAAANAVNAAADVDAVDAIIAGIELSTFDGSKPLVNYESALGAYYGVG